MREKKTIRHYLWVRIFFIVLITVLIIMTLFIAAWQKNTINYLFQSEEKKIIQNQEYISDALERALSLKILSEGTEELSDEQIQSAVQSALYYNVGEIVLFRDSNIIGSNNWGKRNETTYHKGMKVKDMRPINNLGIHDNTRLKNNNNNKENKKEKGT